MKMQLIPPRVCRLYSAVALSLLSFYGQANTINQALATNELSFYGAINRAQKNDPWLVGNSHKQSAVESMSTVASSLPDPKNVSEFGQFTNR